MEFFKKKDKARAKSPAKVVNVKQHEESSNAKAAVKQLLSGGAGEPHAADRRSAEEALEDVAGAQPLVARSMPKGWPAAETSAAVGERGMQHCLHDRQFYTAMIERSLDTCELLQHNLDDYIVEVRRSPSRQRVDSAAATAESTGERPSVNGHSISANSAVPTTVQRESLAF